MSGDSFAFSSKLHDHEANTSAVREPSFLTFAYLYLTSLALVAPGMGRPLPL